MVGKRGNPAFELVPAGYRIAYRAAGGPGAAGPLRVLEVDGCGTYVTQDLSVAVRFDGELLSFEATALEPLSIESFRVTLAHEFARGERVLLNGYQSWTDTRERPALDSMRGLRGVPRPVVDAFALDGAGDYRFAEYGRGPGLQHGYTYGVFRRGDARLLAASTDERRGFTLIRTDARAGRVVLEPECPQRALDAGESRVLGAYALLAGDEDRVYGRWFELSGVAARPVRPLAGYSSWYRHYGDIDQRKLEADLAGAADAFAALEGTPAGPGTPAAGRPESPAGAAARPAYVRLFQIDDGFCKVGDWLDVDRARFPDGLRPLAARIRGAGFLPGLWLAPFVCEEESRLHAAHPGWLLRDEAGAPVRTGPHWSGALALDTRNDEVRAYVRDVVRTVVGDWGFGLLKLDFLYAACMVPHDGLNRGELMADAMRLLREAAGGDCLLLGCGVPLASAFGVADYCRIGCDVGLDWDDKPPMRLLHRERVSTRNSLGNTRGRAPLDGRAFGNDPDVFFLRDDVRLPARRRRELLEADAACGSVLLTSDDMGTWGTAERELFQAALATLLERKAR